MRRCAVVSLMRKNTGEVLEFLLMKVYVGSSLDPYFTCRYGFGDIFGSGERYS
jgi:hypothetical protein